MRCIWKSVSHTSNATQMLALLLPIKWEVPLRRLAVFLKLHTVDMGERTKRIPIPLGAGREGQTHLFAQSLSSLGNVQED